MVKFQKRSAPQFHVFSSTNVNLKKSYALQFHVYSSKPLGSRVGSTLFRWFIKPNEIDKIRKLFYQNVKFPRNFELAEHDKVRFNERLDEFGFAGLEFRESRAKNIRSK